MCGLRVKGERKCQKEAVVYSSIVRLLVCRSTDVVFELNRFVQPGRAREANSLLWQVLARDGHPLQQDLPEPSVGGTGTGRMDPGFHTAVAASVAGKPGNGLSLFR